jgi:hypothetical protein
VRNPRLAPALRPVRKRRSQAAANFAYAGGSHPRPEKGARACPCRGGAKGLTTSRAVRSRPRSSAWIAENLDTVVGFYRRAEVGANRARTLGNRQTPSGEAPAGSQGHRWPSGLPANCLVVCAEQADDVQDPVRTEPNGNQNAIASLKFGGEASHAAGRASAVL